MAVDTETKRRGAISTLPITTMPVADNDIDAADRMHVVWWYGGIAAEAPAEPTGQRLGLLIGVYP